MTQQTRARPTARNQRCGRCGGCGGCLIKDIDTFACLMCGRRDYGPGFRPLGLDPDDDASDTSDSAVEDEVQV